MSEIRWYKGKYKVEVLKKSKGNYLVQTLDEIPYPQKIIQTDMTYTVNNPTRSYMLIGTMFVTVPRLLWKKPKQ